MEMFDGPEGLALWIEEEIMRFIQSPENTMNDETGEPAWAEPLVGFSCGIDPLYQFYKDDIGEFYLSRARGVGHGERFLGKTLEGYRDDVVIATKFGSVGPMRR